MSRATSCIYVMHVDITLGNPVCGDGGGVLGTAVGTGLAFCFCLLNMAITAALYRVIHKYVKHFKN
jgi:hypothetical protein